MAEDPAPRSRENMEGLRAQLETLRTELAGAKAEVREHLLDVSFAPDDTIMRPHSFLLLTGEGRRGEA